MLVESEIRVAAQMKISQARQTQETSPAAARAKARTDLQAA